MLFYIYFFYSAFLSGSIRNIIAVMFQEERSHGNFIV